MLRTNCKELYFKIIIGELLMWLGWYSDCLTHTKPWPPSPALSESWRGGACLGFATLEVEAGGSDVPDYP